MTLILNDIDFMTVDELEKEVGWPLDYTSVRGLIPYINRLKGEDLKVIEVGTCRAESSYLIAEKCPKVSMIYCVDPYQAYKDWAGDLNQDVMSKFEEIAHTNMSKFPGRYEFVKKTSNEAHTQFEDESVDFIFIDGDHSYEATLTDIINYYPKVKRGAIFAGHDYNLADVRNAVRKFREDNKIRLPIQQSSNNTWFWYKP
jgi:predicted O-methyltransferase YrrM